MHAIVRIKPNKARELIQKFEVKISFDFLNEKIIGISMFKLIVNGQKRDEFEATYDEISISGFDIKKDKKINIKIQAIPIDQNWKTIIKESKPCVCYIQNRKTIRHILISRISILLMTFLV